MIVEYSKWTQERGDDVSRAVVDFSFRKGLRNYDDCRLSSLKIVYLIFAVSRNFNLESIQCK